ncbi:hypothetical protein KC678_03705, partial [Candidatus Dojkabacteria bacterium]|nr:hypothetical protein [Candidatus Dojkabacteria bacterium]
MDLLAKTFQGLWHAVKSKEVAPGIVFLEDQSKRLEIISESVLNTSRSIQVVGSEQYIGSQGQTLFLPVKIDIFSSVELNQKLYLNLTLLSSVAIRKQMVNRWEKDSPIMERMRFLQTMGILNQELDQLFNGFYSFQEEIFNKLKFELKLSV